MARSPTEERCHSLEEIANVWKRECDELRKFADLEREAFQSVIDEITNDVTKKNEIVSSLNEKVGSLQSEKMRLSEVNDQLLNENREMKRRAQESLVEKEKEEQSRSVAVPANIEEMNQMAEQIRKLRRQLRSSQVAAKQLQGENQLLKDVTESVSQRPSSHSLKSVLLMDESFQLLL